MLFLGRNETVYNFTLNTYIYTLIKDENHCKSMRFKFMFLEAFKKNLPCRAK